MSMKRHTATFSEFKETRYEQILDTGITVGRKHGNAENGGIKLRGISQGNLEGRTHGSEI